MRLIALAASLLFTVVSYAATRTHEPQQPGPFAGVLDEHPAIDYARQPVNDRVARLARAVARGEATLDYRQDGGYLRAVLAALDVSAESQVLVFSRTGIQRAVTGPATPRALYFNDSVVVGYIPGARYLEIAAQDPEQGIVFYTVEQAAAAGPEITRRTNCLTCHVSGTTLEVPGVIARSNFVNASGDVISQLGFHIVNHRTPLPQRWGGWYVSGNYEAPPYGGVGHMGNVATLLQPDSDTVAAMSNEVFIRWTNSEPETRGYLSADSDIVALMLFDHQMHAMNLLTRLNWDARVAAASGEVDFTRGALGRLVNELVDYFLFVDEVPPPARLTPRPGFAEWFAASGPKDTRGRSLRELDLEDRLLRYPCSYMIYTDAFDHLPAGAREAIYRRMWTILSGRDTAAKYARLDVGTRRALVQILRQTKRDLPASFRAGA